MAEGSSQATGTGRDQNGRLAIRTRILDLHKSSGVVTGGKTSFPCSGELFQPIQHSQKHSGY